MHAKMIQGGNGQEALNIENKLETPNLSTH